MTGGAGFIGRHMCNELEMRGYDVLSMDTQPMAIDFAPAKTSRLHIIQDAREFLRDQREHPLPTFDLVVHCAYNVGGRAAIDGKNSNFVHNVELDAALFRWALKARPKHVLYFSSSAVYPVVNQTKEWGEILLKEDYVDLTGACGCNYMTEAPMSPDARYGWAKFIGEQLVEVARESDLSISVVRPFSGYGEDQSTDYPFPTFIERATLKHNPFTVWGSAEQTRDWIHVDDVIRGALAVVESGTTLPVNLCTGQSTSLGDLITMMCDYVGYAPSFDVIKDAPMGVMYRVGDPTRFHEIYTPTVSLREGIERAMRAARS